MEETISTPTSKKWSTKKKAILIPIIVLICIVLLLGILVGAFFLNSAVYSVSTQVDKIENNTDFIVQGNTKDSNRALYDKNGDRFHIKGVNAGNILLQEGWMSGFAYEPKKDENGEYVRDNDGNLQYDEFTQEDFEQGINNNPNLKDDKDELMDTYYKSFFSEEDFRIVKEELKLNTIRLPFYWRNILNDDLTRKEESVAFSYIDWFIEQCKANELYVILDLHGAPGSQNGFEHSGLLLDQPEFWYNEAYENAVIDLWDYVSEHYTNNKTDLAPYILSYDLLNEPQTVKNSNQGKYCTEYQDKLYKVIRENNDNHLITIEFMWDNSVCPNPKDYGWENVMYEIHQYNWNSSIVTFEMFKAYFDMKLIGHDYDVPLYIGEFTCFENEDTWKKTLVDYYNERGYGWTIWNYKTTVVGWWTSSWGIYTAKLNNQPNTDDKKADIRSCTKEEFLDTCEKMKTENCAKSYTYNILKKYNNEWMVE